MYREVNKNALTHVSTKMTPKTETPFVKPQTQLTVQNINKLKMCINVSFHVVVAFEIGVIFVSQFVQSPNIRIHQQQNVRTALRT
jgi:hypothetical protein